MEEEIRGIIRIANKDLDGNLPIPKALQDIKGMGYNLAYSIAEVASRRLGIDKNEKLGRLTEEQTDELEKIILDPVSHGIYAWMVNRRKDYETGKDLHRTGSDLEFGLRQDIERLKKIKSYRGIRHAKGLPVRGQRTRSTFRKGKTVGVIRKKKK